MLRGIRSDRRIVRGTINNTQSDDIGAVRQVMVGAEAGLPAGTETPPSQSFQSSQEEKTGAPVLF